MYTTLKLLANLSHNRAGQLHHRSAFSKLVTIMHLLRGNSNVASMAANLMSFLESGTSAALSSAVLSFVQLRSGVCRSRYILCS